MYLLSTARTHLWRGGARMEKVLQRALTTVGMRQSESRLTHDSQTYWDAAGSDRWRSDSHWRNADVFDNGDLWSRIGERHLEMVERGARAVGFDRPWGTVVEWGCGGGANAVHFGPPAGEFVGVDISAETLSECERQLAAVCDTPMRPILIEVGHPERALEDIPGACDLFLCCYVFELLPSPEYGERILRIAAAMLAPGGLALIQIKYDDGRWRTRSRRRAYRRAPAEMTTYSIADFWTLTRTCGLDPESVHLVPEDELDERYAYFLLSKATGA